MSCAPASTPDFLGEGLALFLGRLVNHQAARVMGAAVMLYRRLNVRGERLGARIELHRPPSLARPRHHQPQPRVAALAEPAKIRRRIIAFVAVNVIDNEVSGRAAQRTLFCR